MNIDFTLSQTDNRPIYLQIMEQIEQRIAVGDWTPGSKLPSIRALAVSIKVSVITVKRAYLELEAKGVIVTQQSKGSWISDTLDVDAQKREKLNSYLAQASELAQTLAIEEDELIAILKQQNKHRGNR